MIINDIQFDVALEDIFVELQNQLGINGFHYFEKGYRNSGDHIMIQCPFHGRGQEKNASMGIRKRDGICHCFACNHTYSLPELISHCFGYNDVLGKEGVKWLLKNFATVQVEERKDVELDFSRDGNRAHSESRSNTVRFVGEDELDRYRYYHPYWKKRGIKDDALIELFDLGYDYNSKCITFPVRDKNGNCCFVAKRSINTKWFNYPSGVEKPLYGLYEIEQTRQHWEVKTHDGEIHDGYTYPKEIIICESMIDCILLWQAKHYAVALNGLGNDLQFRQLMELPTRKFILATDNDDAGRTARERIKKSVKGKLFTEIDFPDGIKDIGECSEQQIKNILDWEVF